MSPNSSLKQFETYLLSKLEKERRAHLDTYHEAMDRQVAQGLQALQKETDTWLHQMSEQLLAEKNQRLSEERQQLNLTLAALKKKQQERLGHAVIAKLRDYTQSTGYVHQLVSHVKAFHTAHGAQVIRYVFALSDQVHDLELSRTLEVAPALLGFSEHLVGGYHAYLKPNVLADNSLTYHW